jgi:HlyD family secretion protein
MRLPRMTTRRWMVVVVVASLVLSAFVERREHRRRLMAVQVAQAAYQNSLLTRQVAEIALIEYREGVYRAERETVLGEIALAESDFKHAEDRLEWSNRMLARGAVSKDQNRADEMTLKQKTFALEQAQSRKKVLEEYTRQKTLKELQSEVEKAKADELARKAAYERERAALKGWIW